jgi:hypothetical protein
MAVIVSGRTIGTRAGGWVNPPVSLGAEARGGATVQVYTILGGMTGIAGGKTLGPRPFLIVAARIIVVWIKVRSCSLGKPSKSYSVEEMERSDRSQNRALHCCFEVFSSVFGESPRISTGIEHAMGQSCLECQPPMGILELSIPVPSNS